MSQVIKNLVNLSRLKLYPNNSQLIRPFCVYKKELTKQALNSTAISQDFLLQNLKNAPSPSRVLELVEAHHKIMNNKQLLQALRSLFTLQKHGNSDLSTQQILKHPQFSRLCYNLKKQSGTIELNDTIEALKVVCYVGVSSNSTIVEVLLQLLRHNVNELSIPQIVFLDFLLKQFKSTPLVEALSIALPIVFEINLPVKMDKDSVERLAEYLHYVSRKPVSENCIELIVNNLLKCIETQNQLDVKSAKSIIWSICDMEADEFFKPLLQHAISTVIFEIEKLDYVDVETTLNKLVGKYSVRTPFYYNDTFFDACAQYIVDLNVGYDEAMSVLRKFLRIFHVNNELLDYIVQKCHKNPNLILNGTASDVLNIIAAVAMTDYRPKNWESIEQLLLETNCFDKDLQYLLRLKLTSALCVLNIDRPEVFERSLQAEYIEKTLRKAFIPDFEQLLFINQVFSILKPQYKHLLPPMSTIERFASRVKPVRSFPLEGALMQALGGNNYVKTNVRTKLGHHIDHVVAMRTGGYPVSLSKEFENLEDISVPPDSQIILVLALGPFHYTINSRRLRGTTSMMVKTLEVQGYTVVPVCVESWKAFADYEKIPYLMQCIREKTEFLETSDIV